MRGIAVILCVAGFVAANTFSSVQFKYAAESQGGKAFWHFVVGSVAGIVGPISLTVLLKWMNPNLAYALCFGGAFAVLQLTSWRLFNQPLTMAQWAGVAAVGLGIVLLQMGNRG